MKKLMNILRTVTAMKMSSDKNTPALIVTGIILLIALGIVAIIKKILIPIVVLIILALGVSILKNTPKDKLMKNKVSVILFSNISFSLWIVALIAMIAIKYIPNLNWIIIGISLLIMIALSIVFSIVFSRKIK